MSVQRIEELPLCVMAYHYLMLRTPLVWYSLWTSTFTQFQAVFTVELVHCMTWGYWVFTFGVWSLFLLTSGNKQLLTAGKCSYFHIFQCRKCSWNVQLTSHAPQESVASLLMKAPLEVSNVQDWTLESHITSYTWYLLRCRRSKEYLEEERTSTWRAWKSIHLPRRRVFFDILQQTFQIIDISHKFEFYF